MSTRENGSASNETNSAGFREFCDSIPEYISEAVKFGGDISGGSIQLSPDISSIKDLDAVIENACRIFHSINANSNVLWNISVLLGTLLGEMIVNEHGFHWNLGESDIPVIEDDSNNQASPITKIYKIFMSEAGDEGNASSFYKAFINLRNYNALSGTDKMEYIILE